MSRPVLGEPARTIGLSVWFDASEPPVANDAGGVPGGGLSPCFVRLSPLCRLPRALLGR